MLLSTDKVDVLGTLYKIILMTDMVDQDDAEGKLDHLDKVVYIDMAMTESPQRFLEALSHEIIHAYALKIDEHEAITEKDVILMTTLFHQFVCHNPDLVMDLAKLAEIAREES